MPIYVKWGLGLMTTIEKLRKSTFKYIEREVYDLHDTLKRIKELEYEILNETENAGYDDIGKGKSSVMTISDITAKKATALVEDRRLKRLREKANAILKVYDEMIDEKKKLVSLYYWERPGELTWDGVAKELHISRRTALRWREAFIYAVAEELGET